jgi:hypothetical protein
MILKLHSIRFFPAQAACQLHVLGLNRYALDVNRAEVRVLHQPDQVRLGRLLQRQHGRALEAQVGLVLLRDLADEALERQLADQQLSRLLVAPDLAQRDCAGAEAVRPLGAALRWGSSLSPDAAGRWGRSLSLDAAGRWGRSLSLDAAGLLGRTFGSVDVRNIEVPQVFDKYVDYFLCVLAHNIQIMFWAEDFSVCDILQNVCKVRGVSLFVFDNLANAQDSLGPLCL